jgi:hypothetical protein
MRKKLIIVIVLVIGLAHVGYRFHKVYRDIGRAKRELGYNIPCENLPTPVFKRAKWTGVLIDADITYTDGAHNIVPYDLDNDGRVELVANSYRADTLIVYKYDDDPHNPLNWSRYTIDFSVGGCNPKKPVMKFIKSVLRENLLGGFTGGAHYTAIADINGDGRDDLIVAGDYKRYDVVWYETPKEITNISSWEKHIVYSDDAHRTYHVEAGDIDGDGDQDIVFATKTDNSIGWLTNNGTSGEWPVTWVDNNCVRCYNVRVADIDKDGKNDIIAAEDDSIKGGKLHFYKYSTDPMSQINWTDNIVATFPAGHGVSIFEIVDIDRDGDLDIVTGNHQGDVYILENPYPDGIYEEWDKYKVNRYNIDSGHDLREIDVGDIDGDGDFDIIAADEGQNMIIWFENSETAFSNNWVHHIVDKSNQYLKWCHSVELGDIDGDGDLDVAVAVADSNVFLWYSNEIEKLREGK